MHRPTLGVLAGVLLVAGLVATYVADSEAWGSVLIRAGAILGGIWLVLPKAREIPKPVWLSLGAFVIIVAVRPRLILWAFLLAVLISAIALVTRGRGGVSGSQRS